MEITGLANTTIADVLSEEQPVAVFVYTNFTEPPSTPMTLPSMETVAISTFPEFQVPPDDGSNWVESPVQINEAPAILTTGVSCTTTTSLVSELQPVPESRNIKLTLPSEIPVTRPVLSTVATDGLVLDQVPPLLGISWVSVPIQIEVSPSINTISFPLTVMLSVGSEWQWVRASTKTNETLPALTPVTTPALVTVARALLELIQLPPVIGNKELCSPMQIESTPLIPAMGASFTENTKDVSLIQLETASTK